MSLPESGRKTPERPRIETVPQAANVINGLYNSFKSEKLYLTDAYLTRRLLGDEGGTWHFSTIGSEKQRKKIPHIAPVIRLRENVLLGAGYEGSKGKLLASYLFSPQKDPEDGILLAKTGWDKEDGFLEQPKAYMVLPSGILVEAEVSSPADRIRRGLWPLEFVDTRKTGQVIAVNDELRSIIDAVQSYREPRHNL